MPAIEVEHLRVSYESGAAVDDVSFGIEAGEVVALLGPNGAGKTTTIETLEGYLIPTDGRVAVLGFDPRRDRAELTKRIGVMLQNGGLYPMMGPRRALRLAASYYPDPRDTEDLVERVGLRRVADVPAKRLSGGERQRLSLALALVGRPAAVFFDEPTSGIDPAGRAVIRQVVAELRDEGVAVLLTTHELEEAERLADQIVIIDQGRVVAAGRPAELTGGTDEIRFSTAHGIDTGSLARAVGAAVDEVMPGEYLVSCAATPKTVASITAWLSDHDLVLGDLHAGRQRLEDVFASLTGVPNTDGNRPQTRGRWRARRHNRAVTR